MAAIRSAAARISASVREQMATFAPSLASPSAEAYPSPLLAAATNATFPFKPSSIPNLLRGKQRALSADSADERREELRSLITEKTQAMEKAKELYPQITQIFTDFGFSIRTLQMH